MNSRRESELSEVTFTAAHFSALWNPHQVARCIASRFGIEMAKERRQARGARKRAVWGEVVKGEAFSGNRWPSRRRRLGIQESMRNRDQTEGASESAGVREVSSET